MILHVPGRGTLTKEESNRLFMITLEDDLEDSPWMVMGSLQWDATAAFQQSLHDFIRRSGRNWTVAGMMPIRYTWEGRPRKKQLAPDVFVAPVPERPRPSFDADNEGGFPPFVLEVVSPSSSERDQLDKRDAYELLGVREYALFTPNADRASILAGFRRNAGGTFEVWPSDERGRLWSDVLSLYLVSQGLDIRAATPDGILLPTIGEAIDAQRAAVEAQRAAVEAQRAAVEAQRAVARENERLRAEIERMNPQPKDE